MSDERVLHAVRTASELAQRGETQEAYNALAAVRDLLDEVEDEDVCSIWEAACAELRHKLGGDLRVRDRPFTFGFFQSLSEAAHRTIHQNTKISLTGDGNVAEFIMLLRQELEEAPEDDVLLRHRLMTDLAFLLISTGRDHEARGLLQQAESLEGSFEDELPKLQRRIITARRKQHLLHDFAGARQMFLDLLPDAERLLEGPKKLEIYGYILESLWAGQGRPDNPLILHLAAKGCELFEEILDGQPGSAARRRIRENFQRFFEGAVLALLSAAHRVGDDTDEGQHLLARAWRGSMAARNPELRATIPTPAADELRHLRELEDVFHGALRDRLVLRTGNWREALESVHEHEMAVLRAFRAASQGGDPPEPSPEGPAVAFFLVRDLIQQPALCVMGRHKGRYDVRLIPHVNVADPLAAWNESSSGSAASPRREVYMEEADTSNRSGALVGISRLLPRSFSLLPTRNWRARAGETSAPLFPDSWFLFPDGALTATPLEMLPDSENTYFGQGRAVHLCLRSSVVPACGEEVDFGRGWLGLGGVPQAGPLSYLPGSLEEVTRLERLLREQGYPAQILTGPDATAARLRKELDLLKPAVLHIAVHGCADREHPDACALILADDPESPERELLPFRRIRALDLSGTHLVVLSACKSLIGRSGRDAGMQGLAWAFLQAGAAQVIAARYAVRDEDAVLFMESLYRHLQTHTAAAALGHARDECLRSGMAPSEVAAWSVWS